MFLVVTTGAMPSIPAAVSASSTTLAGRGVILSIMDQGNETWVSSDTQATKPSSTYSRFRHCSATVRIPARSFSPLWEQLSMLTMATGAAPAR